MQLLSLAFYVAFASYFIYLIILVIAAFTELRSMPYFDVRLKLQTFLMLFVLTISLLTILLSSNTNFSSSVLISSLPFLRLLPFAHFSSSSATFLSIFSLVNIYICACAYYYRPSLNQLNGKRFAVYSFYFICFIFFRVSNRTGQPYLFNDK